MRSWGSSQLCGLVGYILPGRGEVFRQGAPELLQGMPKVVERRHSGVQEELGLCARTRPFQVRNKQSWQSCVGNPARHLPSEFLSPICANIWLFQGCYHPLIKKKMQRKYVQEFFPALFISAPLTFRPAQPKSSPAPRNECLGSPKIYVSLSWTST